MRNGSMSSPYKQWLPKFSLREFLAIIAFVAVTCGALRFASTLWAATLLSVVIVLTFVAAIGAAVQRRSPQAWAIGALVATVIYGVLWMQDLPVVERYDITGERPVVYAGYLPTTMAIGQLWRRVKGNYYVEQATGVVIEPHVGWPDVTNGKEIGTAAPPGWKGGYVVIKTLPAKNDFYAVGHCLWVIALAYLGGKFANWVYDHRMLRAAASSTMFRSQSDE